MSKIERGKGMGDMVKSRNSLKQVSANVLL